VTNDLVSNLKGVVNDHKNVGGRAYTLDNKGWADLLDVLNLATYFFFTPRKFNRAKLRDIFKKQT